ncbi:hypothetical protein L3X38_037994 [Prunus dulcis]|uniref:Uncharacterized protein n=1 Tax=Prunus dulcis TaxID=3755 RepID=A0AAD4V6N6_PRUDU|nr:hypothetical protein L3X38_037994 [Prunus dulcis]
MKRTKVAAVVHKSAASGMWKDRHSRGKNVLEDYFIPTFLYSDVDFRRRFRMQPHLFNKVMHDICNDDAYFVQKCDATGILGLLPEQKLTAVIRMLAYRASADQVDEIAPDGEVHYVGGFGKILSSS